MSKYDSTISSENIVKEKLNLDNKEIIMRVVWYSSVEEYMNIQNSNVKKAEESQISQLMKTASISLFANTIKIDKTLM